LLAGTDRLAGHGFDIAPTEGLLIDGHAYLNGDDDTRTARLCSALSNPDLDVLFIARGGYGLTRIVSRLGPLPDRVPVVVGFSDTTALHARLFAAGIPGVHGPLATTVVDASDTCFEHLVGLLAGETGQRFLGLEHRIGPAHVVEGPAFAANLCVLTHLVGTPIMPSLEGAILFLEEVGERPYRIDRMLTQLLDSGALEGVAGIVVGYLSGCEESKPRPHEPSALDVIVERLAHVGVPVVSGFPFGHEAENWAIPVGRKVALDARLGTVTFLEGLYAGPPRR